MFGASEGLFSFATVVFLHTFLIILLLSALRQQHCLWYLLVFIEIFVLEISSLSLKFSGLRCNLKCGGMLSVWRRTTDTFWGVTTQNAAYPESIRYFLCLLSKPKTKVYGTFSACYAYKKQKNTYSSFLHSARMGATPLKNLRRRRAEKYSLHKYLQI